MKTNQPDQTRAATVPRNSVATKIQRRKVLLLVVASTALAATNFVSRSQADSASDCCPLCTTGLRAPVVPLTTASLDAMARTHASFNTKQLARIDSLLRTGYYGPPEESNARQRAHLMARISTINAYRDLVRLACDPARVYEADEATLRDLYVRYSDVNLFIGVRLERLRLGMGRVCMRYDVDEKLKGVTRHGGKQLRWRVRDVKIDGRKRRVLNLVFPTGDDDEVEIYIAPHHTFSVEYTRSAGPPAPYEWFLVYDIRGIWLRKWGTHQPTAYMFWVSASNAMALARVTSMGDAMRASGTPLPPQARLGSSADTARGPSHLHSGAAVTVTPPARHQRGRSARGSATYADS